MNRKPANQPNRHALTTAQAVLLGLAGVLVLAWIVIGLVFVSTSGGQAQTLATITAIILPTEAPTPLPTATISAVALLPPDCAVSNDAQADVAAAVTGVVSSVDPSAAVAVQAGAETVVFHLAGIRLPDQPVLLSQAVQAVVRDLNGQPVTVVFADSGRAAGFVMIGDRLVNLDLVQRGLARWDEAQPAGLCSALLLQGQQQAETAQVGLWQPTPAATRTFVPLVTLDPADQPCSCTPRPLCSSFAAQVEAQACYNWCNDYNTLLDDDRDGIACEELP